MTRRIALLGYMGSGKSAVGRALAKALNLPFFDLDTLIETELGQPITEIFKTRGELFFRKTESDVLTQFLKETPAFVLATGGGTPCYGNNLKAIHDAKVSTAYLQTSIPILVKRLRQEKAGRPMISHLGDEDLVEFIGKHIFERSPFYNRAQIKIDTAEQSVEEIVLEILKYLGEIDSGVSG